NIGCEKVCPQEWGHGSLKGYATNGQRAEVVGKQVGDYSPSFQRIWRSMPRMTGTSRAGISRRWMRRRTFSLVETAVTGLTKPLLARASRRRKAICPVSAVVAEAIFTGRAAAALGSRAIS